MPRRLTLLLFAAALCLSCQKFGEGRQMFRELLTLRDQLAAEFHEKVVDVSIVNGDRMVVKLIDSPLNDRSAEEKQQRADAVAAFVAAHYKQPLSRVSTQFVSQDKTDAYVGRATPKP